MEEKIYYGCGLKIQKFNPKEFDVVLYHAGCPDGIGAAWPFWRKNKERFQNDKFIIKGVNHNEPYPRNLVENKRVAIVDFSYKRDVIKEICSISKMVWILDHHKTALRELENLQKQIHNFAYIFDMKRSGAQIVWDACYSHKSRPWFIEIIADRDLWKWEIPKSKEIGKALYKGGWYSWEKMEELYSLNENKIRSKLTRDGELIMEQETRDINYAVSSSILCVFQGYKVRLTTCNPILRSEVGNILSLKEDCDFSATWRYSFEDDQWWISLRGASLSNLDLSKITEKFGGGGHAKACGFTIHGKNSQAWRDSPQRERMASGSIRDYFKIVL